ncbi:MAG: SUMF1/EgtB/PvdO family nonheme iron enzyme [Planctomycetes bacterium]|nr:SUMF1/EgtB/PvdO family nonheme iron enzyme [Planctomycetota bacterium]
MPKLSLWSCLAALVAAAGLASAQGPPEDRERTFVLVVGVEDYADPKITDLSYAEDDAQAVYDFFAKDPRSPTTKDRVRLLLGKQATRVGVLRAVRDHLIRRAVGPKDNAILYFAGHGFSDTQGVYLAVHDTQLSDLQFTAVSWAELQRLWSQIGAGRRLLFADACHSGGIQGLRGPGGIGRRALARKVKRDFASVVIAATGPNELSMEDKKSKHGVFTASLLSGLRGHADKDRNGNVSLGELTTYLTTEVPLRARKAGGTQTPTIRFNGSGTFARCLQISRGKPIAVGSESSQLARVTAEREAAERERDRAELRSQLAEAKLKRLKELQQAHGEASAEETRRAQADAAQAKADLAKAQKATKRIRQEELKRIEAEKRAAKAEAEAAELRREVAELKAEANLAEKQAASARKRERELGGNASAPSAQPDGYASAVKRAKRLKGFRYLDMEPFACGGRRFQIARFSHAKTGLVFHLLPGGTYQRGSLGEKREQPVTRVTIQPFLICATECTQAAYQAVSGKAPSNFKGAQRPVEQVSWDEAGAFCTQAGLRLPSEAEWEYACRAGTKRSYSFGSGPSELGRYAEFNSNNGTETKDVGGKLPNAFGLSDMAGNVWEWCQDAWHDNYQGAPDTGWPAWGGGAGASLRVIRGGSWRNSAPGCRSALRNCYVPGDRRYSLGFRPARSLSDQVVTPKTPRKKIRSRTARDHYQLRFHGFTDKEVSSAVSAIQEDMEFSKWKDCGAFGGFRVYECTYVGKRITQSIPSAFQQGWPKTRYTISKRRNRVTISKSRFQGRASRR